LERLAAVPVTCASCKSVSQSSLTGCKACKQAGLDWPRYCSKQCQLQAWADGHGKVCAKTLAKKVEKAKAKAAKQGGAAKAAED